MIRHSAAVMLLAILVGPHPVAARSALRPVPAKELCITSGSIESLPSGSLRIVEPKVRAVMSGPHARAAELRFTYLGPAQKEARLGSGELRRQLGLKLRAENGCNVVYVMWRIAPESRLVVQVKRNPGRRTHAECHTEGYRTVRAEESKPCPELTPKEEHRLSAALEGEELRVEADGRRVWEGHLGKDVLEFDGPVGLRSDNAALEFTLLAGRANQEASGVEPPGHCRAVDPTDE